MVGIQNMAIFLGVGQLAGDFLDVVLILCQIVLNVMFIKEPKTI